MDPLKPGHQTTEYKVTMYAVMVGAVAEGLATAIHSMQLGGVSAPWFATALMALGFVVQLATVLGYQRGRAIVKTAALQAGILDSPSSRALTPLDVPVVKVTPNP